MPGRRHRRHAHGHAIRWPELGRSRRRAVAADRELIHRSASWAARILQGSIVAAMKNAESPARYVAGLSGWQKKHIVLLRRAVRAAGPAESIKWGNLVYLDKGPVCLLRAEENRVLFGFWRGQRLCHIEPRLKPGGKYEMATLALDADSSISPAVVGKLVAR